MNSNDAYADATVAAGNVFFVKVTSQDGKAVKWYKVTVLVNVGSAYSLKASEASDANPDTSGLTIASATDDGTGVTITLGWTVEATYVYAADGATAYPDTDPAPNFKGKDTWIGASNKPKPAAGKYTAVYIQGLFPAAVGSDKIIALKNTNQALRFFTDNGQTTTDALTSPTTSNETALYLPTDTATPPVRWRVYDTGAIKSGETLGLLIWNGNGTVTPLTATLEIQEWAEYANDKGAATDGYSAKVIIDYSNVTFAAETFTNVSDSYSLKKSESDNSADESGLTITAKKSDVNGIVYITLGGTVADTYQAAATGNQTPTAGGNFDGDTWGAGTTTSAAGKYAAAYIDGLVASGGWTNVAIKQTNHAFVYYTGSSQDLAKAELTAPAPAPGANIYLPVDATLPVKWKLYASVSAGPFGILLWNGATAKTATLVIEQYNGNAQGSTKTGDIATFVIDYSSVIFGS